MGYLSFGKTISFKKATVSLWFRVPQKTIDAVPLPRIDQYYIPVFVYKFPLIVFGKQKTGTHYEFKYGVYLGEIYGTGGGGVYGNQVNAHPSTHMDVTSIGIRFEYAGGGEAKGTSRLYATLQTADAGVGQATEWSFTGYEWVGSSAPGGTVDIRTFTDNSYMSGKPADLFSVAPLSYPSQGPEVTPDDWHHLLLSWDLKGRNSSHGTVEDTEAGIASFIDSHSTMWCALDGENCAGAELPSNWIGSADGVGDPNGICTDWTMKYAGKRGGPEETGPPNVIHSPIVGAPRYSVQFSEGIKADGIFIPAEPQYTRDLNAEAGFGPGSEPISPIYRIELAELQIFSNVMLTITEKNIAAFIDFKRDKDGNPIKDKDGNSTLKPVPPKQAEKLLGKRPDVLLHGTNNWKKGKNTGSTSKDKDGKVLKSGQFKPTGTIKKYEPDPSIKKSADK